MKTKYTFVLLMVFFTLFAVNKAKSQFVTGSKTIGSGSNQLDISISVDSSFNILKFVVTGPSTKWFGFSYNTTSMSPGSYTILCNVNGGNPGEYIMVEHAAPTLQSTQNLQNITSSTSLGRKTFTFYRNLTTSDANDYVFSYFANNINIAWAYGSGLTLTQHESRGSSNINFINPCTTIIPTILPSITICQGDSTMIFGSYKKVAGTYQKNIKRQLDCDSILAQVLNVIMIDTMIINVADSIKAVQGADSYQWYNCTTNQPINNATNYFYVATVSGNYRVKITKNNCVSYSSCYQHTITGISNIRSIDTRFQLHPNPASDKITLNFDRFEGSAHIEIFDITGKSIINQVLLNNTKSETIDVSMLKTGIYFVKFTNNEQSISKKLIIN